MQRRAKTYATSLVLALALSGSLTACSGSSGSGSGNDSKPGGTSETGEPAPPGKYRTLPEPCGSVSLGTLKSALPGAAAPKSDGGAAKGASATPSPYEGKPSLTYDTDRRVGCHWKSATSLGTRHLSVDMERVVSYDSSVSDDSQARELYQKRAQASHIPDSADPSATEDSDGPSHGPGKGDSEDQGAGKGPSKGKEGSADDGKGGAGGDGTHGSDRDGSGHGGNSGSEGEKPDNAASPSATSQQPDSASPSPDDDLSPRTLGNIGDNAYIDDKLDTADSGEHRDITLVFRSANVIVTVKYDQWLTDKRRVPDSAELQQAARRVAGELASDFG